MVTRLGTEIVRRVAAEEQHKRYDLSVIGFDARRPEWNGNGTYCTSPCMQGGDSSTRRLQVLTQVVMHHHWQQGTYPSTSLYETLMSILYSPL
jgi:hypothetical protein